MSAVTQPLSMPNEKERTGQENRPSRKQKTEMEPLLSNTSAPQQKAALDRIAPMLISIRATKPTRYVVDVAFVWRTMLATTKRLEEHKERFLGLTGFNAQYLEHYADIAHALVYMHNEATSFSKERDDAPERASELMQRRTLLSRAVLHLIDFGALDSTVNEKLHNGTGYDVVVADLLFLLQVFTKNSSEIAGKHCVPKAFLTETAQLTEDFGILLSDRARRDEELMELQEERACIVALAAEANKAIRRAAIYLELDSEDGSEFAPSIFNGGSKPRTEPKESEPSEPEKPKNTDNKPVVTSKPVYLNGIEEPSDHPFIDQR